MLLRLALAAIAFGLLLPGASAQNYPDHAVKIIVPIGPAGSYDILGRLVADQLSRRMGQTFVVENRPGAGSVVPTKSVVVSPPDGYTLLIGGLSNIVFNAGLYKNLSYDPLADLVPVALIMNFSYTLVGANSLPYSTPKEIVEAAKKNPGAFKLANAGVGTGQHVVGAAFFDSTPAALPYVKSGQAKGIAVLAAKRHPDAPDMPTMTESGVPGLEIDSWIGIFAPARTPPAIIALLQKHIAEAGPEMKLKLANVGGELMEVPPEKLNAVVKADTVKWLKIIKDAGISLD